MDMFWRQMLFAVLIRPVLWFAIGLRVRNRKGLPAAGPAIVVANHNSHLDTLVLLALAPFRALPLYRPAAAADHFLKPGFVGWAARTVLRIIPIDRSGIGAEKALAPVCDAVERGEVVVLFPEGSRGEPESLARFRRGIALLVQKYPCVPVVPVFLHGLGRAMPRGTPLFVPFFCDVAVGGPMRLSDLPGDEVPDALARAVTALGEGLNVGWHEGATGGESVTKDPHSPDRGKKNPFADEGQA